MSENFKLDFIGIGAARSGTSWLSNCLRAHPDICMSEPKEIQYFNLEHHEYGINKNHTKAFAWYANHFRHCKAEKIKGEFSPIYFYDKKGPELITRYFPDIKLILSLRNPIDRAYSQYWLLRNVKKIENREFEKEISDESHYIEQGFYAMQLRRYLELFKRDQIFILIFEDLRNHPLKEIVRLLKFLDVRTDIDIDLNVLTRKTNESRKVRVKKLQNILEASQRFLIDKRLSFIFVHLRKIGISGFIKKLNAAAFNYPPMRSETRKMLRNLFDGDIKELEMILNRDLSHWR
jgi:hypothetical protein